MAENVTIDGATGQEISRVTVPDPPPPEPTAEERLATLLAALTDADGNVTSVEQLTGLAVVVVPLPTDPLLDATDPRDTTKLRRT